jgi:hypothetical protein
MKPRRCYTVSVLTCLRCSAALVLRPSGLEAGGSCGSRHLRFSHLPQPGRLHNQHRISIADLTLCCGWWLGLLAVHLMWLLQAPAP